MDFCGHGLMGLRYFPKRKMNNNQKIKIKMNQYDNDLGIAVKRPI